MTPVGALRDVVRAAALLGVGLVAWAFGDARPGPPAPELPSRFDAVLAERRARAHARVGGVVFCFAPGTSPDYVEEVRASAAKGATFEADDGARWSSTATDGFGLAQGDPTTLTWSVVPDGTLIPAAFDSPAGPSDLRAFLDDVYGDESTWGPILQRVFDRWGELCGVTYVYEPADDRATLGTAAGRLGVRADVRIGGRRIDGNFGVLAYNSFPNDGDMVIDTADSFFRSTGLGSRRLRNVVAHEHGHGLALDHVCPQDGTKLLEPAVSLGFDGPQHDDVLAAQRLYGDTKEPNDSRAAATDLGSPTRRVVVEDVSIDDDTDTDWYAFTVPEGSSADVSVKPVGRGYRSGPQLFSGACSAGSTIDTRRLVDLRLALFTDGGDLIASTNATGRGEAEDLDDVALPLGAGRYHVRVRGSGENDPQLYELSLLVAQRGAKPVAVDDDVQTFEVLPVAVEVLANDQGVVDEPLEVRVLLQPRDGEVRREDRTLVYVPDRDHVGDDSFRYRVTDAHGQESEADVRVTTVASERAGAAREDGDDDGHPDEWEVFAGTDPEAAEPIRPTELDLRKLKARLRPRIDPVDRLDVRATVEIPDGFEPEGAELVVQVGGVGRSFVLDRRGRGALDRDRVRLRVKRRRGTVRAGPARVDLRLRRGDFAADLADEGLTLERRTRGEPRAATVVLRVGGTTYLTTAALRWTAKPGRKGKAKLVRR